MEVLKLFAMLPAMYHLVVQAQLECPVEVNRNALIIFIHQVDKNIVCILEADLVSLLSMYENQCKHPVPLLVVDVEVVALVRGNALLEP